MLTSLKPSAALFMGAAFVYTALISFQAAAQAPIVDASVVPPSIQAAAPQAAANDVAQQDSRQLELFDQLQQLQLEVMQLRGIVEEQSHLLRKMKQQNTDRYIDVDRRLSELAAGTASAIVPDSTVNTAGNPVKPVATTTATNGNIARRNTMPVEAGEKARYDAAYAMVIAKQFDAALEAFRQFLLDYPAGHYAPNSYYWMGELYQVINPQDLDASREAFAQLLGQYPDHAKAGDAMYKLGKVYFLRGDPIKSRQWLEKVISKGAKSSAAKKAQRFLDENFEA